MRSKTFLNPDGVLVRVAQLPPLPLLEFQDWLQVLEQRTSQRQRSLEDLYLEDRLFGQVCDRILALHQLTAKQYPHELVIRLVTVDLPDLNRMAAEEKGSGEPVSVEEWVYSLIAALIDVEGVRGAIATAESVPCDLLDGILKARAKQLKTDKKPSMDDPVMKELIEELDADLFTPMPK
jgi:hypothetical protein